MGTALESCCREPTPTPDPIQDKKKTIKKRNKQQEDGISVPDSNKTNAHTADEFNGEGNGNVQNLSD